MNDLRLIGLSDDGRRLVMESGDGNQYSLPVDERINAALRGDRSRLGQLQIELESKLTPREIQDRIRAGQSLEQVSAEAGVPTDRVLRYAGPILQEREHIAQEAAKAGVKRHDHGAVMLLGELVRDRLEDRGVPHESMTWDAWRREDGGWEVRLEYVAGQTERSAQWVYDPARRTVTPDDEDARWLLEEEAPSSPVTHLRPVPPHAPEDEATSEEPPAPPAVAQPAELSPAERSRQRAIEAATRNQRSTVPDAPTTPRKKKASVPSWDEIVFGSKKPE
jgi:hypothetical protein